MTLAEQRTNDVRITASGGVTVDGHEVVNQRVAFVKEPGDIGQVTLTVPVVDSAIEGRCVVVWIVRLVGGMEEIEADGDTRAAALRNLAAKVEDWEKEQHA